MSRGVSLVVPTRNAGPEFPQVLERMLDQELDRDLEVLVIDSGSTDGTVEHLETRPVRLIEIPPADFNHGLTRNRGIAEARGEIVALATQDALPADRHWLQRLVDCFADPQVAGAYSRQLPRPDAGPFIRDRLSRWMAAAREPRVQAVSSGEDLAALPPLEKLARAAFDNVSSAVRRRVALKIPFRELAFGEDLDWGYRVLQAGYRIVFEPRSLVVHSHRHSTWYEFRRVYLDHQNLHRLFGVHTVPRLRDVAAGTAAAVRHLWRVVGDEPGLGAAERLAWRARALSFGFSQSLAQYLGARSVRRLERGGVGARLLDRALRRGV